MKQIELTSKLVLAIIGLVSVGAILIPTYAVPTIRSADIFDGEVKSADLANSAVTNPKLANDAVTSSKIKNGEVKAEDIAAGVIPSGGIQGTMQAVKGDPVSVDPGHFARAFADCPDGTILTGGGFSASPSFRVYTSSVSFADGQEWFVDAENENTFTTSFNAVAECLTLSQ